MAQIWRITGTPVLYQRFVVGFKFWGKSKSYYMSVLLWKVPLSFAAVCFTAQDGSSMSSEKKIEKVLLPMLFAGAGITCHISSTHFFFLWVSCIRKTSGCIASRPRLMKDFHIPERSTLSITFLGGGFWMILKVVFFSNINPKRNLRVQHGIRVRIKPTGRYSVPPIIAHTPHFYKTRVPLDEAWSIGWICVGFDSDQKKWNLLKLSTGNWQALCELLPIWS